MLSAEGYDIKNELVLIPIHQSILKSYGKRKDNRKQCYGGEEMLVGTILRKSAGDKEEKFKACIINFPVQYLKKKKKRRVLCNSPVMQIPHGSSVPF